MPILKLNNPPGDELFWILMAVFALAAVGIAVVR